MYVFNYEYMYQEIVLKNLAKPISSDVREDVDWLCESFGFASGNAREPISTRIIYALLEDIGKLGLSSTEELSSQLHIAPQKINYHIRSISDSGFLYRDRKHIFLRDGSVKAAVEEMRKDANRVFDKLSAIASDIDDAFGLKSRDL